MGSWLQNADERELALLLEAKPPWISAYAHGHGDLGSKAMNKIAKGAGRLKAGHMHLHLFWGRSQLVVASLKEAQSRYCLKWESFLLGASDSDASGAMSKPAVECEGHFGKLSPHLKYALDDSISDQISRENDGWPCSPAAPPLMLADARGKQLIGCQFSKLLKQLQMPSKP